MVKPANPYEWRRRRDSNPRDPFGAYTISSRARSTKLRDFSTLIMSIIIHIIQLCAAGGINPTKSAMIGYNNPEKKSIRIFFSHDE
jgi:hypothetical protein